MGYSTPTKYVKQIKKINDQLIQKPNNVSLLAQSSALMRGFHVHRDDSFPYAMNTNQYWSGFYSTRPQFKRLVKFTSTRFHSSLMMSSLEAIKKDSPHMLFVINQQAKILDQLGTIQLHDSITGTLMKRTSEDYFLRAHKANNDTELLNTKVLSSYLQQYYNISVQKLDSTILSR